MTATLPVDSFGPGRLRGCIASRRAALLLSCLASCLSHCLSPSSHCAALLSSRCATLSSTRRASLLSHRLSSSSRCADHLCSRRAGWLLRPLSTCHPLVVSSSCCAASRCLVAPAGCHIIISRRPLVTPPSRSLIVLAGCCVASPCAALWLSHHLLSSSHCAALSSYFRAVALPLAVLSLRRPLIISSRQLVVASPLLIL